MNGRKQIQSVISVRKLFNRPERRTYGRKEIIGGIKALFGR